MAACVHSRWLGAHTLLQTHHTRSASLITASFPQDTPCKSLLFKPKRGAHIKICPHLHRTTSIHNELLRFLSHVSETRCNRATMPTQFLTGKHRIVEWNSSLPPPNEICICARGLAKDPEEQVYKCWCVCLSLLHTTCLMCLTCFALRCFGSIWQPTPRMARELTQPLVQRERERE